MAQERLCKNCGSVLTKQSQKMYCCSVCASEDHKKQRWAEIEKEGESKSIWAFRGNRQKRSQKLFGE